MVEATKLSGHRNSQTDTLKSTGGEEPSLSVDQQLRMVLRFINGPAAWLIVFKIVL